MMLLREVLGDTLRSHRLAQRRTLREVSKDARVSLGYLSEVERGQKEASSELLAAICEALSMELSDLLRDVGDQLASGTARFTTASSASRRAHRAAPRQRTEPKPAESSD
jgi:transcriptional regulator with XRE-family HTH domain